MKKRVRYVHNYFLSIVLLVIVATGLMASGMVGTKHKGAKSASMNVGNRELSSLKNADAWINSSAITASQLEGKVVLIQFCTYTCINWLRTLPYVRAWAEKYKDKGLVVIGVHSPEFPFEKDIDNVRRAIQAMNIEFPIAIDNRHVIWSAFTNQYWPALYFLDGKGRIRHTQFGEGAYEQSEKVIRQLLIEGGARDLPPHLSDVRASGVEVEADWANLRSAENYLGYVRTENYASNGVKYDKRHVYAATTNLLLNQWALSGNWTMQKYSIVLNEANGRIVYRFHARDFHLVMGPTVAGASVRFRVLINGTAPGEAHGADIDEQGRGRITDQRLYQLIRQSNPVSDCKIEIEFFDHGVEAFAVTFG